MAGFGESGGERILVIEDDEDLARLVRMVLEREGFEVSTAVNAVEALGKIEAEQPAAIVADVMMPGASGVTLLEHLRGRPETRDLPVLVYTGSGDDDVRRSVEAAGGTRYLTKPAPAAQLVGTLRDLLGES